MKNGSGLKILGDSDWYGPGYCGICGDRESIFPRSVRWWDPDDGWKFGVLCPSCMEDVQEKGPQNDDFACQLTKQGGSKELIDMLSDILDDDDALYSELT